jgi:hypothetical protein
VKMEMIVDGGEESRVVYLSFPLGGRGLNGIDHETIAESYCRKRQNITE